MKSLLFRLTRRQRQICYSLILAAIIAFASVINHDNDKYNKINDKDSQEVLLKIPDNFLQEDLSDPSLSKDEVFIYKSYGNKSCAIVGVIDKSITTAEITTKSPIGDIVIEISNNAFDGCDKLTLITISESIKEIAADAFIGCNNLISIMTNSSNTKFCSISGVLMSKDKSELICYPANKKDNSYLLSLNIKRIDSYAFYGVKNLELLLYEGSTERFEEIYVALGNESFEKMPITCNYRAK